MTRAILEWEMADHRSQSARIAAHDAEMIAERAKKRAADSVSRIRALREK